MCVYVCVRACVCVVKIEIYLSKKHNEVFNKPVKRLVKNVYTFHFHRFSDKLPLNIGHRNHQVKQKTQKLHYKWHMNLRYGDIIGLIGKLLKKKL